LEEMGAECDQKGKKREDGTQLKGLNFCISAGCRKEGTARSVPGGEGSLKKKGEEREIHEKPMEKRTGFHARQALLAKNK